MKKYFLIFLIILSGTFLFAQKIKKLSITELESYIRESKKPLVVNFWATFCKPCVEEIPYIQHTIEKKHHKEIELLLVSLDLPGYSPSKIASFANKKKFTSRIIWLNETNSDVFCPKIDSSWTGVIPASLFINNQTGYRKFFEKQLTEKEVVNELELLVR